MNVVNKIRNKGMRFSAAFHEGSDALGGDAGLPELLAEIAGILLMCLNAVLGLLSLLWPFSRKHPRRVSSDRMRLLPNDPMSALTDEPQPHTVWVLLDSNFRYRDMSASFCELLALNRADLIGRSAEDFTPAEFVDLEAVRAEVRMFGGKTGFWVYLRRDGRFVLVRYSIRVRKDSMAELYLEPLPVAS
jgi:PAS domain S-box-containing protein